jgi:hypothetical protein
MERTDWKSQNLIYDESECRLIVYLELSGVAQFDWVGAEADFEKWTVPDGEPISTSKRQEILDRLSDWAKARNVRIDIGRTVSAEEMYADYEKRGWRVENKEDGSTLVSPPPREGLLKRIARLFR